MLIGSIAFACMALLTESVREQISFPWITIVRSGLIKWLLESRIPSTGSLIGLSLVIGANVWVFVGEDKSRKLRQ